MHYHNPNKKNSTITTRVMCAIVFCVFSFSWLYWFQGDVLAVAQHVLSDGVTHYDRTVGALLITLFLQILQLVVSTIVRLQRRTHALTYLPSFLVLTVVSDVNSDIDLHFSFGSWYWIVPLVLLIWGGLVWLARQVMPFQPDKEPTGVFSRRVWINMMLMSVMMLTVAAVGNTNAVFHYRAHVETVLLQHDVDEALRTGKRSLETDEHLTMLRAYALSLKGELGERLFEYPVVGTGNDLLPMTTSRSRMLLLSPDSLFLYLGAKPRGRLTAYRYLELLELDTLATAAVADYRLCCMLVDKRIDDFARLLPTYYAVNDSLPKHYKEALTLYTHQRSYPTVVFHSPVMDEDWADFQRLEAQYQDERERRGKVEDHYVASYWYYYFYR